jgi:hypothetical protein
MDIAPADLAAGVLAGSIVENLLAVCGPNGGFRRNIFCT